ncbi:MULTISPECIES: L-serine ammonia-lyase [Nitrosomonas]|uniref:L-serine dehydratase n=1 Tax=Nitrosomonas europaea (strain ATCC 19718 / CIP 103999 / KCTC 2705 / NBRC 14298) TaxID=228410 RepID=Q82XA7_NITEU|nr:MULTISPECIES: L-serine ammonia-lyase [Nitrosomonas]CAD84291.1 Iron-sulfur-dependent L-serine dehydratase single chain form [Nitrosomonas europaea ATCC 19718]SDW35391.1 L-serine ammonia-lyase [Nitrosomonas europaea]SES94040.1 L-serine ammonia-lyase [Nitrosomonas europaea]SJZ45467.1 L-serine ammonia-lyase [Nitrosomonas europaea]HBF26090.1 L-serine ammonia-lyase [Nitrosomonas sp.]
MFISVLDLFKIGIGPSSSHTMGPMTAANVFRDHVDQLVSQTPDDLNYRVYCVLKGSLAFTGRGHATDRAVALGLHGHSPVSLAGEDVNALTAKLWATDTLQLTSGREIGFNPEDDIVFDKSDPLPQHPNGMIFYLLDEEGKKILSETFFSIGGGFICTLAEINQLNAPLKMESAGLYPYPFDSAIGMLEMSQQSGLSIAEMKRANELTRMSAQELEQGLDSIWKAMCHCVEQGLTAEGRLPGGLSIRRRAKDLYEQLQMHPEKATLNDWLCAYAMAVNEENAAGHMVVTAPTNGAAGVIPAVIYYLLKHEGGTEQQVRDLLLTAAAIGGLIKHLSSISGAEVGCQGEVGSAAAMAAAGLCAVRGGTTEQVENAAEIALEHHLGMTCDPVGGLVQVPCIERNGFGAIKAHTAAALACRGTGEHFIPLDNCINAMKQTGLEMSHKYKETSLGGLAVSVSITEC